MGKREKFIGKWAKEGYAEGDPFIEFRVENGEIVKSGNYENLKLHSETTENGTHILHFSNLWPGKDETVLVEFQSHFVDKHHPETGTFINAQEFRLVDEKKLQHKLMGYRFDETDEKWIHFETEVMLHKIS